MKTDSAAEVLQTLRGARRVAVLPHEDPDGDSLGSAIAVGLLLEHEGREVIYFSADPIPRLYDFLPRVDRFIHQMNSSFPADIVAVFDCGDVKRVGSNIDLRKIGRTIVNVDHHLENGLFGDFNLVEIRSSTAEIVYGICKTAGFISRDMATALYTGLIMDTGNFRYDNTNATTLKIAADLVEQGAHPFTIASRVYERRSLSGLQILAATLAGVELMADGKVAAGTVTHELLQKQKDETGDLPSIVDFLRSIDGVEVAVLFKEETTNRTKVNFRSKEYVNVQQVAKQFGGGGHWKAAGCVIEEPLALAKSKVLNIVCQALQAQLKR